MVPLGYQIVSELKNGEKGKPFFQIRFVAKIKKLNKIEKDPATGVIPERKFINPQDFLKYCPWGKIGQMVIGKAVSTY